MKKTLSRPNGYLALFATFLVVGGVVFAAVLATPTINPDSKVPNLPESPVTTATPTSTGGILVVDHSGAMLYQKEGSRPLSWPDDVKLLGRALSQMEGVDAKTGEHVYLTTGFVRATSTGIHSPDGRRALFPSPARADGTGSVEIRLGNEKQTIVLRVGSKGVKDVMPLGWWDAETIAVTGRVTSTRMIYAATLAGEVTPIAIIPDNAADFSFEAGSMWYVTLQPGAGLESPPGPPSELHRLSRRDKDVVLATETTHVISVFIPFISSAAYQTDAGDLTLLSNTDVTEIPLGKGTPLAFIDATHLVIRRDGHLIKKDAITGLEETVLDMIPDGAAVFVVPGISTQP
ncbi:MAG: hypothetical protein ABIO72_00350 [Patescibacteria group bacterium]